MSFTPTYATVEDAVAALRPDDQLGVPLGPGQPAALLHGMAARDDWAGLTVFGALLVDLYEVFLKPGVRYLSGFYGPAERFLRDSGADIEFVPADFRRFAPVLERLAPRVMATLASAPNEHGQVSLSLHSGASVGELRRAAADPDRLLIVEVNEDAPRTYGIEPDYSNKIHVRDIDILIKSDRPVFTLDDPPPTDVDLAIADHVSAFVEDGCTLQSGIGAIPSTVLSIVAEHPGGDYGIHSEMFTTGLMKLHQSGKVSNARKGIFDGVSICTFAAGTAELNSWLHENSDVRFLPVEVVNSPEIISRNRAMVSVNGALAVDLHGQVVADTIGGRQFSGIGGHEDFVAQSGIHLEDRSLICLPSTFAIDGEIQSRIQPHLVAGQVVTTPRHQLDVIVTEHGAAELRGLTVRERAEALAAIAAPQFRDELLAAAGAIG